MRRSSSSLRSSLAGSTLMEAMVACGIVSLFFAGLYQMNWRGLYMLKSAMDGSSANQVIVNVAEQIRTANWTEITDPTYLSGTVLAGSTATGHLPNVAQTIDVYPYPGAGGGVSAIEVQRDASGSLSTPLSGNGTLAAQTAARVDITLTWKTALNSTSHKRMLSLIICSTGVLGSN